MTEPATWTAQEVGCWVRDDLQFPQYAACFETNHINGSKLSCIDATQLSRLGVSDFGHIKLLAAAIRKLFSLEEPNAYRTIANVPFSSH
eukprot:m.8561 g.8561  ORF g.8561 m.8561 type:complete len:89 (+) comp9219_c0_seq1:82-348(+)